MLLGAGIFKLLANNKVCQQGAIRKTANSLEACKARCAAVAACAYLAWWEANSKKECVHYSYETCQTTGLSGHGETNQLFKKIGSGSRSRSGLGLRSGSGSG